MLFELGNINVTAAAATALRITNTHLLDVLARHGLGDSAPEDPLTVLKRNEQVITAYPLPGSKLVVWVVTELDSSATFVLLDWEEYR